MPLDKIRQRQGRRSTQDPGNGAIYGKIVYALEVLTGVSFTELDQQYGEYVTKISQSLKEDFTVQP